MIFAVEFERRMTGASVLRIIVGEFGHRQESSPIILLKIDEGSEVDLHSAVLPFGLAISLRVESNGEPSLDPKKVA